MKSPKVVVSWSHSIRVTVLALLLSFIITYTPWRLVALTYYVMTTPATMVQVPSDHDRYWDAIYLAHRLEQFGWTVTYVPVKDTHGFDAYGLTFFQNRAVVVEEALSWTARYAVLAHEGGHTMQPASLTGQQKEVFAEIVAALVTRTHLREHARYLARTRGDYLLVVITEWQRLYRVATILTTT